MYSGSFTVPPTTAKYDFLLSWYVVSAIIAGGFVIGLLLFFAVKYRAREGAPPPSKGPESLWVVVAVVLIMGAALAAAGYQSFAAETNIEIPNLIIKVAGKISTKNGVPVILHVERRDDVLLSQRSSFLHRGLPQFHAPVQARTRAAAGELLLAGITTVVTVEERLAERIADVLV